VNRVGRIKHGRYEDSTARHHHRTSLGGERRFLSFETAFICKTEEEKERKKRRKKERPISLKFNGNVREGEGIAKV
jgi:hypothetical protein